VRFPIPVKTSVEITAEPSSQVDVTLPAIVLMRLLETTISNDYPSFEWLNAHAPRLVNRSKTVTQNILCIDTIKLINV
jgi:hypothetical protein